MMDLKMLLDLLDHPWDVIGISEMNIREQRDISINVSIDGYDFIQTPEFSLTFSPHMDTAPLYYNPRGLHLTLQQ